jgi:hypothetical protein
VDPFYSDSEAGIADQDPLDIFQEGIDLLFKEGNETPEDIYSDSIGMFK